MGLVQLKVKIKSLAAEARIIRREERRYANREERPSLVEHRRGVVRSEARCSLLAYAYLRHMPYRCVEASTKRKPDWGKIDGLIKRFAFIDGHSKEWGEREIENE